MLINMSNSKIISTQKITPVSNVENKDLSISSCLSSIHSSGIAGKLPSNPEKKENIITPSMKKEDLHSLNNQKQASKIAELLGTNITADMVKNALNFGGMGDLNQQAMNYRPESSLIILTLLEPHEMGEGLLKSAAKMIQDLNQATNDTAKVILKNSLEQFDKKIQHSLSGINGDSFLIMEERFKDVYIKPEFENILQPYLAPNMIKQLSMDDCLLSEKNKQKQAEISVFNSAYQKAGKAPSVDQAHYMHSMFSVLEESLEIVQTLKTTVNWQEHSSPSNLETPPLQVADETDGITPSPQSANLPHSNILGSYNTTNNYHFGSPFGGDITKISHQNVQVSDISPEEPKSTKPSEEPDVDYELPEVKNQPIANSSRIASSQPVKEPEVDYKLPEVDNAIYQSKGFVVSTLRGTPPPAAKVSPKSQSAKQEAIKQFLPKNGHLLGSYLKNGEVPTKVTLSTEGALTRHQSDKEIYQGTREAPKTVVDTASYQRNSDAPVTLTERGALTRDQSKKDAYTTGQ